MSFSRLTGLLASLLTAILLAFTIPAGAPLAQMNSWQIQQQRQQEMLRQQQIQQEQMRRQQQEQLRQQQRQQLQAQQRQQMQAQQRQAIQQQQQQALQQQQRNKLQKQQIDQAKNAQQVGKPPPTGTPAHIANKPTGPMVFSNGVARLTRPLTPAEISRGFTGKVTPNGRALIKFQGRIFAVPASRVSGLTAKPAAQQRQARWTAQQQGSINEKVKRLTAATTTPPPPPPPKSELNDRPPGGGGGNAGGPCDPRKSLTCNFNTQTAKPGPVQVVKSPAIQASIDETRTARIWQLREPNGEIKKGESSLIGVSQGLQSRRDGRFANIMTGSRGDPEKKYLWTIDDRGVNIALEKTPAETERRHIVHTNISNRAYSAGEAWFQEDGSVTLNAGSGRFGDGSGLTEGQYRESIKKWESLGYKVNVIPLGKR